MVVEQMTQRIFDSLPEYSGSLPTGTIVGKTWKRKMRNGSWWIGEYVSHSDPKLIGISWRKIEIVK